MAALPEVDLIRRLPLRVDAEVTADCVDANGHMNVTQYLRFGAAGIDLALRETGVDDDYRDHRRLSCFGLEHYIRYLAEMHLGDRLTVHPQVLARSSRSAHALVYLVDATNDRLANTLELMLVHVDMDTRRAVPFPEDVAAALDAMIESHAVVPDPPVCGIMGVRT